MQNQWWGCKVHHRKFFSSVAYAEPWVSVMHSHQTVNSSGMRKDSSSSAISICKKALKQPGKEIPFPQVNQPAEALLQLLDTAGFSNCLQKNGRDQPAFALFSKSQRKGEDSSSLLSPTSLTIFHQSTAICNSMGPPGPPQGMTKLCLLVKVDSLTLPCPCSCSKPPSLQW